MLKRLLYRFRKHRHYDGRLLVLTFEYPHDTQIEAREFLYKYLGNIAEIELEDGRKLRFLGAIVRGYGDKDTWL